MKLQSFFLALATPLAILVVGHGEECIGCQVDDSGEDSGTATDAGGCTISIWSVIDNFHEDCGNMGVTCAEAACDFGWKVKYQTSGTCSGFPWTLKRIIPAGSDQPLPPSSTPRTIVNSPKTYTCGQTEAYHYKVESASDSTVFAEVSGKTGCNNCETIP